MAAGPRPLAPPLARSISFRLFLLTVVFVLLSVVLIFAPSLASFRMGWLEEKTRSAWLAAQALRFMPEGLPGEDPRHDLLVSAGVQAVALRMPGRRILLFTSRPQAIDRRIVLRELTLWDRLGGTIAIMLRRQPQIVHLLAPAPTDPRLSVEVVFDDQELRHEMLAFCANILLATLVIACLTGGLLYLTLFFMLVRPMRRIAMGVADFAGDPVRATAGLAPTARKDEIGLAQTMLVAMQDDVRASLNQKEHLAALGSSVSKINHDLRGILSTALLMSDSLSQLDNPDVKRLVPPLVQSIDRAITLCTQTLAFARDGGPRIRPARFRLSGLVTDLAADIAALGGGRMTVNSQIDDALVVEADRDQIYRVFANLASNAMDAGAARLTVTATETADTLTIGVADNGPGLPRAARDALFTPFTGSVKTGGSGLGLSIARDIVRAHGGDIGLHRSDSRGTIFRITLPRPGA